MKKILGFTLAELMIAMAVLGILLAVVMPTMTTRTANKNKMYIKKAYYTTTEVVSALINDPELYPGIDEVCKYNGEDGYIGFDCWNYVVGAGGSDLFAYDFFNSLNTIQELGTLEDFIDSATDYIPDDPILGGTRLRVTTNDGIVWELPRLAGTLFAGHGNALPANSPDNFVSLAIDVNGDAGPNCYQGEDACEDRTDGFDRFIIDIFVDGKIDIRADQPWAEDAIQVGSSLTGR